MSDALQYRQAAAEFREHLGGEHRIRDSVAWLKDRQRAQ